MTNQSTLYSKAGDAAKLGAVAGLVLGAVVGFCVQFSIIVGDKLDELAKKK